MTDEAYARVSGLFASARDLGAPSAYFVYREGDDERWEMFTTFRNGWPYREGTDQFDPADLEAAIDYFVKNVAAVYADHANMHLVWRKRPIVERNDGQWSLYARLAAVPSAQISLPKGNL